MEIVIKNPVMMILLLFVPLMIVLHYYFFEHIRRRAMKFSNFSAMKRVTGTHLITKNTSQLVIRVIVVVFLVFSAAWPVIWYEGDASITDYVIAIDASASMLSQDVLPDRLTVAKQSAANFVNSLDAHTQVGLITFSGISFIKTPITSNLHSVREAINKVDIELASGTDIGGAMVTSTNLLVTGEKSKAIILITDGSDTAGSFVDDSLELAIDYAKSHHVVVHTVGIGSGLARPGYLQDSGLLAIYDTSELRNIAESTGGRFYEVKSSAELAAVFMDIERTTEKSKLPFELAPYLMAAAFILLIVEWGLLNTRFRAIP
jgi:Ca-activated chloride channel homolog